MQKVQIQIKDSSLPFSQLATGEFFKWCDKIWVKIHDNCDYVEENKRKKGLPLETYRTNNLKSGAAYCFSSKKENINHSHYNIGSTLRYDTQVLPATNVNIQLTFEE